MENRDNVNQDNNIYKDGYTTVIEKKPKNKKILRNTLITIGVVLGVLVIATGGFVIWAINQASVTDNLSKFDAQPNDDLIVTLCESVIFGKEKDVSNVEINSYLVKIFEDYGKKENVEKIASNTKLKVDAVAVYFHEDTPSEIFAKIKYGEQVLVFSAKADIALDAKRKEFSAEILETKIGNLQLPTNFVLDVLFNDGSITTYTDKVLREDKTLKIPSYIEEEFLGQTLTLEIKKFDEKEARVSILTTSASDLVGEFLTGLISGLFN